VAADTPHFNFPFRITPHGVDVVDQDTVEDVANCVIAIIATVVGSRDFVPEFGVPNVVFMNQPLGVHDLIVSQQKPRAVLDVTERVNREDPLNDIITVKISTQTKKQV